MFPKYPYLDLSDRNLDFLTKAIREMENEVGNFVSINAVKYANPIQWSINRQYEKNTVVIVEETGVAYISVAPVPRGINILRTQYWTPIFDLSRFLEGGLSNFANHYERDFTYTATMNIGVDEWLVWNSKLWRVIVDITIGDMYAPNVNIERITVEGAIVSLIKSINAEIQNRIDSDDALSDRIDDEVRNRQDADAALDGKIDDEIGTLTNLTTDNKTNLVNAINEVDAGLTQEIADRTNAINTLNNKIGSLPSLNTTDKTNLVSAINEIYNNSGVYVNVLVHGLVNDGVTDNGAALTALFAAYPNGGVFYFPSGNYLFDNVSYDIDASKYTLMGENGTQLISVNLASGYFLNITSPLTLKQYDYARIPLMNISIMGSYFTDVLSTTGVRGVKMGTDTTLVSPHMALYNVVIRNFGVGLELSSAYKTSYFNLSIIACNVGIYIPNAGVQQAVPCNFYSIYVECCNVGIYGLSGGYNSLSFFGGAFEYNRTVHNCYTKLMFSGVRFEYDCKASCQTDLTPRPVFQGSPLGGSSTVIKYIGCFFLGLNNFEANVTYWIANPYKATSYNISPIYVTGGDKVSIVMTDCEIVDINMPSGTYYIGTDKFYGNGNYVGGNITAPVNPSYVVTGANGFIT